MFTSQLIYPYSYQIDRSEGGSSMQDGSIELMLHRRTLYDDSQGVGEPINETAYGQGLVIRGRHLLLFESPSSSALYHRPAAQHLYLSPIITFALPELSYADYSNNYYQTWSALTEVVPYNVHLLTIDQLTSKTFLIRLEHYFELNEDDTYSKPVQIDLQLLFNHLGTISDVVELALAANFPLNQMQRLVWMTDEQQSSEWRPIGRQYHHHPCTDSSMIFSDSGPSTETIINLAPMQIKTFQVALQ